MGDGLIEKSRLLLPGFGNPVKTAFALVTKQKDAAVKRNRNITHPPDSAVQHDGFSNRSTVFDYYKIEPLEF